MTIPPQMQYVLYKRTSKTTHVKTTKNEASADTTYTKQDHKLAQHVMVLDQRHKSLI